MKLREYQAKKIFAEQGIPIPRGKVTATVEQVRAFAAELDRPVILKPQLGFKGRGKLGIIAFADTPDQAAKEAERLFNLTVKDEKISRLLVEEKVDIGQELYLAVTVDYSHACPVMILSRQGGVEIEELAKQDPGALLKIPINMLAGFTDDMFQQVKKFTSQEIADMARLLYHIFRHYDAELAEINPLVMTKNQHLVAVDAVLNINDDSLFRHPELARFRQEIGFDDPIAAQAAANSWTYIDLGGDIAILSSGAGLTMTILDLIHYAGGSAANFLDTAQIDDEGIYQAFQLLMAAKQSRAILVNIFAGLNRCDKLASGIRNYLADHPVDIPIVVRMIGNREAEGHAILKQIGLKPYASLEAAVEQVVAMAKSKT